MTPRQTALLNYHRDVASIGTSAKAPVFVILDLEDSVGFKIASMFQPNCAEKRDAIKDTRAYPAFTLALPVKDANAMLANGWPNAKKIGAVPANMIPVMLISEERCLVVLVPRE
jgi:hypothetical protein